MTPGAATRPRGLKGKTIMKKEQTVDNQPDSVACEFRWALFGAVAKLGSRNRELIDELMELADRFAADLLNEEVQ
jgi:hypothetical protein